MRTLHRKLLRDLGRHLGQAAAVAAVTAVGIATLVTMQSAYRALIASQEAYYRDYRFADVFAPLKRAPEAVIADVQLLPGVAEAEGRLVFEATVSVPNLKEPATCRLVSVPARLNLLHLREGRLPEAGHRNQVVVSEAFASANRLRPGDILPAVLNGRWTGLVISGIAISPEYVYELRGGSFFPDNERFGIAWMDPRGLAAAFRMEGAFNDLSVRLAPSGNEAAVIEELDRLLARYGGLGAYGRSEHVSHRFLSDEIRQDRVTGVVVPVIFLGISAFLTNLVLARLVSTQRDQIATLKAFGYSGRAIVTHYLLFALVPVGAGNLAGVPLGAWLGIQLAQLYANFFRFPALRFDVSAGTVLLALAVSVASAVTAVLRVGVSVMRLPPAEAMRPESPAQYRRGLIERLNLQDVVPLTLRMILRNLERRPFRAIGTAAGMGMAVAVLLVGRYFYDAIEHLIHVQFNVIQRESASLSFQEVRPESVRLELQRLPGVMRVEPFRAAAVRLRNGHRTYRLGLLGIESDNRLRQLVDLNLQTVRLPDEGLLLTRELAEMLAVRPGEDLGIEFLEGARSRRTAKVAGTVDEMIGLSAYIRMGALSRLLREQPSVNGAFLLVDPARSGQLYGYLRRTPVVASVTVREAMLAGFEKTVAESIRISTGSIAVFSIVIAFAMVYNGTRISLSERSRELASLRVLGFGRREVATILLGEQALLLAAAIPAGFATGYGLCHALARAMESDLYRMPVILSVRSYCIAVGVILLSAAISWLLVARGISRLSLVESLKTRE